MMNKLRAHFNKLESQYGQRNEREKLLIVLVIITVLYAFFTVIFYDPIQLEISNLNSERTNIQNEIVALSEELNAVLEANSNSGHAELVAQKKALSDDIEAFNQQIKIMSENLIAPGLMPSVLEDLVQKNDSLRLISMRSLSSVSTQDELQEKLERTLEGVYKHPFEITFEGSFLETYQYLTSLEELRWQFYWDRLTFSILSYPTARITLRLHTLSDKKGWVGV